MIDVIGHKRFMTLCVLGGLLIVLALSNLYIFGPNKESTQRELNAKVAETKRLQAEVDKMRSDFVVFERQKVFFDTINKMGFFNDQDRILARERFDTIQKLSRVNSAKYSIRAASIVPQDKNFIPDFVVMASPIELTMDAIDDIDLYRFIYFLNYGFPGHITIKDMVVERKAPPLTAGALKQIGGGVPPDLVSAKLGMTWTTMARKDSILPQDGGEAPAPGGQQ